MSGSLESPGSAVRRSASGVLRCDIENEFISSCYGKLAVNQLGPNQNECGTHESESPLHEEDPFQG